MALRSNEYDDIYFSEEDGAAESAFVYLNGNGLPGRFATQSGRFTIGELGFGTGLNFLLTARAFLDQAPPESFLLYFAVERHFLPLHVMDQALAAFGDLREQRETLIRLLRDSSHRLPGFHTLFFDRRIRLTLLHGDVDEMLSSLDGGAVDAWYPDGFAPAKNPAMWTEPVFAHMARLSRPGTTLATFTSAGAVRRGLEAAGFRIEKVPGFGSKREMIRGIFEKGSQSVDEVRVPNSHGEEADADRRAAVVGAGLSGITTAASLLLRGWTVDLYDMNAGPAEKGSGNPAGLFMPYLTAQPTAISRFTLRACETLVSALRVLGAADLVHRTGILRLTDDALDERVQKAIATHGLVRSWIRRIASNRYFVRKAGWAEPHSIAHRLVAQLEALYPHRFRTHWQTEIRCASDVPNAHAIVLASGTGLPEFAGAEWIPLKSVRGQLFIAPAETIQQLPGKKRPAVFELYLIAWPAGLLVGATFEPFSSRADRDPASDERLIGQLADQFPVMHRALLESAGVQSGEGYVPPGGRVGFRPQMKDYVPVIGPLPDRVATLRRADENRADRKRSTENAIVHVPAVFVQGGGGSRGVMGSVLASELLAAWMNNEPFPVEGDLVRALLPERFILRELRSRGGKKIAD